MLEVASMPGTRMTLRFVSYARIACVVALCLAPQCARADMILQSASFNASTPDIPLLVVEGRGGKDWLHRVGLGKVGGNLHVMANTPDPRDFYRVTKAVLVPS